MDTLVQMKNVNKSFGSTRAMKDITLEIPKGRIVGLVGPNGAGKTTMLRALTGSIDYRGSIRVLGLEPESQRKDLMAATGVIQDVPVLPQWMRVNQIIDFMAGVHPGFNRARCEELLSKTSVGLTRKIKHLSKGMKTQLHLSLVMATKTRLLILDEPTHGLDILFRKRFYSSILEDYFNEDKSVLISTHQVEEVEHILSDIIFIREGALFLNLTMEDLQKRFLQLVAPTDRAEQAHALGPLSEHDLFGKKVLLYQDVDRARLETIGEVQVPSVADIFVALMGGAA